MYLGGRLLKGGFILKKFLPILVLAFILTLTSCRKVNQTDTQSSNNSSTSSVFSLPERDNPNSDSSSKHNSSDANGSNDTESSKSSDEYNEEPDVLLSIYVDKPYYRKTVKTITFTLYNNNKNKFTYENDFFLQIYKDGDWKYYPTKNGEINYNNIKKETESYIESVIFNLKNKYDLPLDVGTYRIIQESDSGTVVSDEFNIAEDSYFDGEEIQ